jgi:catechol 2,3-dioxygenase-like lactoylglutathione lyase family enzyme
MKVKGVVWLGTRTPKYEVMVAFFKEITGLSPAYQSADFTMFELPDGDRLEVFGADSPESEFMTHPVAGFLVDDIAEARSELEAKGIEFIGNIEHAPKGYAWTHFRAPDGFVYELTQYPGHPLNQIH